MAGHRYLGTNHLAYHHCDASGNIVQSYELVLNATNHIVLMVDEFPEPGPSRPAPSVRKLMSGVPKSTPLPALTRTLRDPREPLRTFGLHRKEPAQAALTKASEEVLTATRER